MTPADADAAADAFTPAWASDDADQAAEAFKPAWATDDDTSDAPTQSSPPAPVPAPAAIVGAPVISVGVSPEATKPLPPAPGVPPPPEAIVATMQSNLQGSTKSTTLGISPSAQALVDAANAKSLGSDTTIDVGAKTLIDAKQPADTAFGTTAPMLERPIPPKVISKPPPASTHNNGARSRPAPMPFAAVDPFASSASDDDDLAIVKPKTSKGLIFGVIAVLLAVGAVAFVKFTGGHEETTSKPAETASSLAATAPSPTNDIPPPPPKEEVTPPPAATTAAAAPSASPAAKTAEPPPKAPEPPPVTHAARPEPDRGRVATAPPRAPRPPAAPPPPKTPPKPAGGGIVRDSPF